ncbi:tRNA uridine-5-carboxymethylaminomethyl(34) synthesis GTPase MnmE [Gemmatimonadota bacterium]
MPEIPEQQSGVGERRRSRKLESTDTIAALSTPPGVGALAVLRLSGPGALPVLRSVCPKLQDRTEPRRSILTQAVDPASGELLDRVLVTVYPGPASYTGEDMVEVSCHGGWISPALILDACLRSGARQAEEGEFTRRAYLNGKMDLLQVEAVLDLIEGRSRALHGAAIHQVERGLSQRIAELREGLVHLEALLVHHLDFPEEDDPPVPIPQILEDVERLEGMMETLLRTAPEGELLREGAVVVLAGQPNTGKSSLFNALVGEERAIVTEDPGTTRDALETVVSLGGFPFRLVDTAGIRDVTERVERLGIEVAWRYVRRADVLLFCVEGPRPLGPEERWFLEEVRGIPVVLVRTKADLSYSLAEAPPTSGDGGVAPEVAGEVEISVVSGRGLSELRALLPSLVFRGLVQQAAEVPVLTRRRQGEGVRRALAELRDFRRGLEEGIPAEIAATHLRPAETALEELLGVIPREEILDRLFREFCIGK